ncbi:hypothetical protein NDI85_16305 [Halomicroarcula sp. S1AR25-4]|uniref:hypothetical protein n=1 Tax=Haloarcula sp. S1AR25-4 TaxID=2950538 RepID=UPI002875BD9A|nr:hypothetical protein [Halomicroarcula sp. S1AR25-4]MDS0279364.1 hypothetical protein [Halomicroarcula sp. S1AR25-4]
MNREERFEQARDAIHALDKVDEANVRRDANDVPAFIRVHLKTDVAQTTIGITKTLKEHDLKLCLADAIREHMIIGVAPVDEEEFGE